jgi:hypothetical protein
MKENEELARSIIPVSSDLSGFSRGTDSGLREESQAEKSESLHVRVPRELETN